MVDHIELSSFKKMKVAAISISEMGHFIPIANLAESLQERGHEVTIITNSLNRDKTEKLITKSGCKPYITEDDIKAEDLLPKKGYGALHKWLPFMREAFKSIQPDIVILDILSTAAFVVADELAIPVVINLPGSLKLLAITTGVMTSENTSSCCGVICVKQKPL